MESKWRVTLVAGVLALVGFGIAGRAIAMPENEIETVWYSDPGRTQEVGRKVTLGCYGQGEMYGTTGPYNRKFYTPCS